MAERGLEQWDAVVANLREALEIYINLGDREMIGRSVTELTEALFWAGRFQEATETARAGLLTFRRMLALTGRVFSPPSGRPAPPPGSMSRPARRSAKR